MPKFRYIFLFTYCWSMFGVCMAKDLHFESYQKSPFVPSWLASRSEHSDETDKTWSTKEYNVLYMSNWQENIIWKILPIYAKQITAYMSKELRKSAILLIDPVISSMYSLFIRFKSNLLKFKLSAQCTPWSSDLNPIY